MSAEIQVLPPDKDIGRELATPEPPHASSDDQLLELWLHGRSLHTQRAYRADVHRFRAGAGKGLARVTLAVTWHFTRRFTPSVKTKWHRTRRPEVRMAPNQETRMGTEAGDCLARFSVFFRILDPRSVSVTKSSSVFWHFTRRLRARGRGLLVKCYRLPVHCQ